MGASSEPVIQQRVRDTTAESAGEHEVASLRDIPARAARAGFRSVRSVIEAVVAGAMLLVLAVPILLIALIIRLDSRGPALFLQSRLGRDLRPFTFYKFRTMHSDAAKCFPEMYDYKSIWSSGTDFDFKQQSDPRITRAGRVLRRTGLDELPNLINVLLGDCAFVGPRPDIPDMMQFYNDDQRVRFSVPQGLVCLAQVKGANRLSFGQTADLDAEYAHTRSIWLDAKILLLVFVAIARGDLH